MPLAGTGSVLGSALTTAAGSTDGPGTAAWGRIGDAVVSWTATNGVVNATGGTPLTASAAVISGTGGLAFAAPASTLGSLIVTAAGSTDAVGISRWNDIARALVSWMTANGTANPASLIGFTGPDATPGPVSGTGALVFANTAIGPSLATAAGSTDTVGITRWGQLGTAILNHVAANTIVTPTMTNPGTGGPVVGTGALS